MTRILVFFCVLISFMCCSKRFRSTDLGSSPNDSVEEQIIAGNRLKEIVKGIENLGSRANESYYLLDRSVDLDDATIVLPFDTIAFAPGAIMKNGIIKAKDKGVVIKASPMQQCFKDVTMDGNWKTSTSYLEWFLSDLSDPTANSLALRNSVIVGKTVYLQAMYELKMLPLDARFDIQKPIHLTGENPTRAGLIIDASTYKFYKPFFRSDSGSSVMLKNISILTKSYTQGIFTNVEEECSFSGSYYHSTLNPDARPNINYVIIENCNIKGAIILSSNAAFESKDSLSFAHSNKISKVLLKNCSFDYCNVGIVLSNMQYDSIIFEKNVVRNISSSFLSAPQSGLQYSYNNNTLIKGRKYVRISNNHFENSILIDVPTDRQMTTCVIKGGDGILEFKNNTVKNLLSTSRDADVHTWYYTCTPKGRAIIQNNVFLNVLARSSEALPASLVKERGASNLLMTDNSFIVTREALTKLGIISNVNASLANLDAKKFYVDFIQNTDGISLDRRYRIERNVFKCPIINKSTQIMDVAEFIFRDNLIEIERFGSSNLISSVSKDNVMFLGRQRLDRKSSVSAGNFIMERNNFKIKGCDAKYLRIIHFSDGVQTGRTISDGSRTSRVFDQNYNFDLYKIKDTIEINNTTVSYSLLDAKNTDIEPTLIGENNSFEIEDPTGANHTRLNTQQLTQVVRLSQLKSTQDESSLFCLVPKSNQTVYFERSLSSFINILSYYNQNAIHNLQDKYPIDIELVIDYVDLKGISKSQVFHLKIVNNATFSTQILDRPYTFSPYGNIQQSQEIGQKSKDGLIKMIFQYGDEHQKPALKLLNTEGITKTMIKWSVF